jgi:hypothetical protein
LQVKKFAANVVKMAKTWYAQRASTKFKKKLDNKEKSIKHAQN